MSSALRVWSMYDYLHFRHLRRGENSISLAKGRCMETEALFLYQIFSFPEILSQSTSVAFQKDYGFQECRVSRNSSSIPFVG